MRDLFAGGILGKWGKVLLLAIVACLVLLGTRQSFRASAASGSEAPAASASSNACVVSLAPQTVRVPGGVIYVSFAPGPLDLAQPAVLKWVRRAAVAVTTYYGRFPLAHTELRIVPVEGEQGIYKGVTFGERGGFTRMPIGQHTSEKELEDDWTLTHEFVHLAFPDLPRQHRWVEEGLATYVEPIARAQAGQIKPKKIWHDMMRDMPKGQPAAGDQGLDHTHTWARTYWGGALFFLRADVTIRELTQNRYGLQDALRAIVAAGGTQDKRNWPVERALEIGDVATGTKVLEQLYAEMKSTPVQVNLNEIWRNLGIQAREEQTFFKGDAELAAVREAITRTPTSPAVLVASENQNEHYEGQEAEEASVPRNP